MKAKMQGEGRSETLKQLWRKIGQVIELEDRKMRRAV